VQRNHSMQSADQTSVGLAEVGLAWIGFAVDFLQG